MKGHRLPVVAFALAVLAIDASAAPIVLSGSGDLRYACGGIGSDERRAMEPLRGEARIEIVLASAQRGTYLSDVRLSVRRDGAPTPAIDVVAGGPICLVDAPPGTYRIEARRGEVVRVKMVKVPSGHSLARAVMAFPDEPWDGIRASEEEKRQARTPD